MQEHPSHVHLAGIGAPVTVTVAVTVAVCLPAASEAKLGDLVLLFPLILEFVTSMLN